LYELFLGSNKRYLSPNKKQLTYLGWL
jgi:hypothetical protein